MIKLFIAKYDPEGELTAGAYAGHKKLKSYMKVTHLGKKEYIKNSTLILTGY